MNNENNHIVSRRLLIKLPVFIYLCFFVCLMNPNHAVSGERLSPAVARQVNRAYDLLAKGEIEKAISGIMDYQKKGGDHYLLSFALGNAYMSAKKYHQAKAAYEKTLEAQKDYAPAWYNMAACEMEMKQYRLAGDAFVKAYDLSTEKKAETLYYAGNAYLTAEGYQQSLETFQRLLENHATAIKPEWKAVPVQALLALNKPREALSIIEELAQTTKGKRKIQWQEMLLQQYLALSMNQKALAYAGKLAEADPLEKKWWKGLVHINLVMDRYKAAMVALTVYSHLTDLNLEEKKLMADLALFLEIPERAVALLEEALAEKWESSSLKKLVQAYRLNHQPDKALLWVEKGLKQDDSSKEFLWLKGNLLFSMNKYGDAANILNSLTKKDPSMGEAWLMLGYAAWNAGKLETARRAFEKASHFKAHKKSAIEALSKLKNL